MKGLPKINQQVEITVLDEGTKGSIFKSRVEDFKEEIIVLAGPMVGGDAVTIMGGTKVTVSWWDALGGYVFDSEIIGGSDSPLPLLYVKRPQEIRRVQRRRYVRLETRLPITYSLVEHEKASSKKVETSETKDISGGGVALETPLPVDKNALLELQMLLPSGIKVQALGRIVRVTEIEKEGRKFFSLGIDFDVIDEKDREKIIGLIFQLQRELRRKGLL